jgi:CRISPR type III-A-associated protein Csm2
MPNYNHQGGGPRGRDSRQNFGGQQLNAPRSDLPKIVLRDPAGNIPADLLTDVAEKWAEIIKNDRTGKEIKSHQLRRFYNDLKGIEKRVNADSENFARYLPLVGLLKAKVAYASKKIPGTFKQFIETGVNEVGQDKKKFEAFCLLFQAVVGYLYGWNADN